jgi:hypothetical protein
MLLKAAPTSNTRPNLFVSMRQRFQDIRLDFQEEMELQRRVVKEDLQLFRGTSRRELDFRNQIRCFENDLHSEPFVSKLNSNIQHRIVSGTDFIGYYKSQPDLKEYTLEKELHRIQYTLITPQGSKLTKADHILDHVNRESQDEAKKHELLYRAANQSIFADVIIALTSFNGLVRPQLCAGTFVDKCSITIDLSREDPHVRAQCFLNVSIPDYQGNRLSMASILVSIFFCPSTEQLRAGILHLLPLPYLTEEEMNGAAKSLAD